MLQASKLIPQGLGLAPALLRRAPQIELDWDLRQKSRFDATDTAGQHIGVFLPRGRNTPMCWPAVSVASKRLFWRTSQSNSICGARPSRAGARPRPWGMSLEACSMVGVKQDQNKK